MKILSVIAKIIFSAAAVIMLWFSVCVLGLCAYCLYTYMDRGETLIPGSDLVMMPWLGVAVFMSSLYILMGRRRWQALVSGGALLVIIAFCLLLLLAGALNLTTPWAGDEINMGLGIGSYSLFLLIGVVLKSRGFWDAQKVNDKTPDDLES